MIPLDRPADRPKREGDPDYGDRSLLDELYDVPEGYERIEVEGTIESHRMIEGPDGQLIGVEKVLLPTITGIIRPIQTDDESENQ